MMVHKSSILAAAISVFWKVITMLSIQNAHEHDGLSRAGKSHLALLNTQREGKRSGHVIKYLYLSRAGKSHLALLNTQRKRG